MATVTEPFPALTNLCLESRTAKPTPVLPDAFLGGNTPRLQRIFLEGIPYLAAPTLLSSARDLVRIDIHFILPDNGYISPEEMVASLSVLPRLKYLSFGFHCRTSYPRRIRRPPILAPISRAVLPSLTTFIFDGLFKYLEEFVSQIDTPQLECLKVYYTDEHEGVDFQIPQLLKFVNNRSGIFKHHQFTLADLDVEDYTVSIVLDGPQRFKLCILDKWIIEMLGQISGMLSNVDLLRIWSRFPGLVGTNYDELGDRIRWVELLRSFTAVKALSVEDTLWSLSRHVVLALKSVTGESTAEILPALELLCLENEEVTLAKDFVAAHRNLGRPVTFINCMSEFEVRLEPLSSAENEGGSFEEPGGR